MSYPQKEGLARAVYSDEKNVIGRWRASGFSRTNRTRSAREQQAAGPPPTPGRKKTEKLGGMATDFFPSGGGLGYPSIPLLLPVAKGAEEGEGGREGQAATGGGNGRKLRKRRSIFCSAAWAPGQLPFSPLLTSKNGGRCTEEGAGCDKPSRREHCFLCTRRPVDTAPAPT